MLLMTLFCWVRTTKYPAIWLLGSACGLLWGSCWTEYWLDQRLPSSLDGTVGLAIGKIEGIPHAATDLTRFRLRLDRFNPDSRANHSDSATWQGRGLIQVNCYRCRFEPKSGESWSVRVKLKTPRGLSNPGLFDYERWLFQQRIVARGTVIKHPENHLVNPRQCQYSVACDRDRFREFTVQYASSSIAPIINALTLGLRHDVPDSMWDLFRATGTSHLMAISGLHIGLVFLVFYGAGNLAWRCSSVALLKIPAQKMGALVALPPTIFYAAMAGWSLPTQRALAMLAVFHLAFILGRTPPTWHSVSLALVVVLLIDPLAPLSHGFWLSFGAVGAILWQIGRQRDDATAAGLSTLATYFGLLIRVQVAISLIMIPMGMIVFSQVSWVAPFVNLIAIPYFSFAVMPLVVVGLVLWYVGLIDAAGWFVRLCDVLIEQFISALGTLNDQVVAEIPPGYFHWVWISLLLGAGLFLKFKDQRPFRALVCLLLAIAITPAATNLDKGQYRMTVLDVGQGLAILIETKNHLLVFDTGARYGNGFDAGRMILDPLMAKKLKPRQKPHIMVSHGDNDHAGGLATLLENFEIVEVLAGVGVTSRTSTRPCHRGQQWLWDNVHFKVLSPIHNYSGSENNGSCVLRISAQGVASLLTGDIEQETEQWLLEHDNLGSDILLVPHHGSHTSSTRAFLTAVNPEIAIISRGHLNRFGHPHSDVLARLQRQGALVLDTAKSGAITIIASPDGFHWSENRLENRRRWSWSGATE